LKEAHDRAGAETQRGVLEKAKVVIAARAGANGRLFGSVTEADIVNGIRTAANVSLDRTQVTMDEHLKQVGSSTVSVHLFDGVDAVVNVEVIAKS
jgi:large subunit ribosomal protein L9